MPVTGGLGGERATGSDRRGRFGGDGPAHDTDSQQPRDQPVPSRGRTVALVFTWMGVARILCQS